MLHQTPFPSTSWPTFCTLFLNVIDPGIFRSQPCLPDSHTSVTVIGLQPFSATCALIDLSCCKCCKHSAALMFNMRLHFNHLSRLSLFLLFISVFKHPLPALFLLFVNSSWGSRNLTKEDETFPNTPRELWLLNRWMYSRTGHAVHSNFFTPLKNLNLFPQQQPYCY